MPTLPMRILCYVPLAPRTPKIYARTITSLFALDWPEYMPVVFGRNDSPVGTKYQDICAKHNEARRMVLDGDYDALFLVENDMILPPDTLYKLTALHSDVAYGLYVGRHGMQQWLAFTDILGYGGTSLSAQPELAREAWGRPLETRGVGMGCTLIRRHVLERLEFRTEPNDLVADDWMFSLDCIEHNFRQMHHLGVACGHIAQPGGNARILWPDPGVSGLVRVEFFDDSQLRKVLPGEKVQMHVSRFGVEQVYGCAG